MTDGEEPNEPLPESTPPPPPPTPSWSPPPLPPPPPALPPEERAGSPGETPLERWARARLSVRLWQLVAGAVLLLLVGAGIGSAGNNGRADRAEEALASAKADAASARRDAVAAAGERESAIRERDAARRALQATTTLSPTTTVPPPSTTFPPPTSPPGPKSSFDGDGVYRVGIDIQPGTYRSGGPASGDVPLCYWERLSEFGARGIGGIIANGSEQGPAVVTIDRSDVGFRTSGCQAWSKV